jgi:sporulation protein YlmC with PRC-barrel domain
MPFITSKKLIGLEVFTEAGSYLGKVSNLEIDVDTHAVLRYIVKSRLGGIIPKELIIGVAEVISISLEKMVVRDGVARELAAEKKNSGAMEPETGGIAMLKG